MNWWIMLKIIALVVSMYLSIGIIVAIVDVISYDRSGLRHLIHIKDLLRIVVIWPLYVLFTILVQIGYEDFD